MEEPESAREASAELPLLTMQRVEVELPETWVALLDRFAYERICSRSDLIRQAIRHHLRSLRDDAG